MAQISSRSLVVCRIIGLSVGVTCENVAFNTLHLLKSTYLTTYLTVVTVVTVVKEVTVVTAVTVVTKNLFTKKH